MVKPDCECIEKIDMKIAKIRSIQKGLIWQKQKGAIGSFFIENVVISITKTLSVIQVLWLDVHFVIKIRVNHDTAAMFTYNDLLMLAYLTLALWRDHVKATAA